jgi:hypothetical protein
MNLSKIAVLFFVSILYGCGPKVSISPEANKKLTTTIAILPVIASSGIQRERVDYIQQLLRAELENSGFLVLDDGIIKKFCNSSGCQEREEIAQNYGADAFFEMQLDSTSRVNFFAGYYNSISGVLNVSDTRGGELVKISHTERERGGVVFESGQILQGIVSQVNNSRDKYSERLGSRFIRKIVSKIPKNKKREIQESQVIGRISKLSSVPIREQVSQVCLEGTENSTAVLVLGRRMSTLRQISPGKYCGIFRSETLVSVGRISAELRSPFGVVARKELEPGI